MCFSKKWHPQSSRQEYITTFSISKWNELPITVKKIHTISNCDARYNSYSFLQSTYPGKPLHEPEPQVVQQLPPLTKEKELTRIVLSELNPVWENRFNHTFTENLPKIPEINLARKITKMEHKKEERGRKQQIVSHINEQFTSNTTLSILAEAESLADQDYNKLLKKLLKKLSLVKKILSIWSQFKL